MSALQPNLQQHLVKPIQMILTYMNTMVHPHKSMTSDRPKMAPFATSVTRTIVGLKIESEVNRNAHNHNPVSDRPKSTSLSKKIGFGFFELPRRQTLETFKRYPKPQNKAKYTKKNPKTRQAAFPMSCDRATQGAAYLMIQYACIHSKWIFFSFIFLLVFQFWRGF